MPDADANSIRNSELSLSQLDGVSGGAPSLGDYVKQMMLISTILKDLHDTRNAITANIR